MNIKHVLAAGLVTATGLFSQSSVWAEPLNFGIISTESSVHLKQAWDPFLEAMKAKTGLDVKAFFASDYAGIIEAMLFKKVDFAWTGNKGAIEMVDRAGGEVFAQVIAADGSNGYYSYLIVNKDSTLQNLDDVLNNAKNLVFSNGDPNSTSGYLVPNYYVFAKRSLDPRKIFKRTLNASHEANGMSVANHQADVATFNSEAMGRLKITQPQKAAQLRIIWQSPIIPGDPLVWRRDLNADTKEKIKAFILSYGKGPNAAAELNVLKNLQWSGFHASDNSQLDPVRVLEYYRQKTKVQESNLSESEKQARLAEIDVKMKALSK